MTKKTILLLSYSVSPVRGSEYSVGWNHIKEMSQEHNLVVLYGLAGDHMGDLSEVEGIPQSKSLSNIEWVAVRPNKLTNFLNTLNRSGILNYSFYLAYRFWHLQAYQVAKKITENRTIDVIHYLCPIGFREPGFLWKIDKPYIWGPLGGVENRSIKLAYQKKIWIGVKIFFRNLINKIQFKFSGRVRSAFARSNLVLAATTGIQKELLKVHKIESIWLPENGIVDEMLKEQKIIKVNSGEIVNIIWVGRLAERKSLDILLKALGLVESKSWKLSVIGGGSREEYSRLSQESDIFYNINWVGEIDRQDLFKYYRDAHIHVISSLAEANSTVIWEAMSFGIPTISLDHFGMHDVICERCGIKISTKNQLNIIIENLAKVIENLIREPSVIENLSYGVQICSKSHLWSRRRLMWNQYYDLAISRWVELRK
jgi:glycosyltransferase involved in cell wall biosynthesis